MRLAVCSSKGGVGKTATAANLAATLATRGRTLAVDVDPQDSLGRAFGVVAKSADDSLAALLDGSLADPRAVVGRRRPRSRPHPGFPGAGARRGPARRAGRSDRQPAPGAAPAAGGLRARGARHARRPGPPDPGGGLRGRRRADGVHQRPRLGAGRGAGGRVRGPAPGLREHLRPPGRGGLLGVGPRGQGRPRGRRARWRERPCRCSRPASRSRAGSPARRWPSAPSCCPRRPARSPGPTSPSPTRCSLHTEELAHDPTDRRAGLGPARRPAHRPAGPPPGRSRSRRRPPAPEPGPDPAIGRAGGVVARGRTPGLELRVTPFTWAWPALRRAPGGIVLCGGPVRLTLGATRV